MTKNQELEILDKTIAALGADTYCGPWLATIRFEVEQSLRSDIFPDFSLREARIECARLKDETTVLCKTMRDKGEVENMRLRAEAFKKADEIASIHAAGVKESLRQAKWALDKVIANLP